MGRQRNIMIVLVVGASGATGRLLVRQLLESGHEVRVIVRSADGLAEVQNHSLLSMTQASISDLGQAEMLQQVNGCGAVASCLGHNLTLKGIYGLPRRLVTDATRRLCAAIKNGETEKPTRFILMNTAGNRNRDLDERILFAQRCVIGIIRLMLPPHSDNERAAEHLRTNIGQNDRAIEWVVVRPDTLIDEDRASAYDVYPSPIRSALFNPGKASRVNVAHFMSNLINDVDLWGRWKGQMPVIYNKE